MKRYALLLALAAGTSLAVVSVSAKPIDFALPAETATFKAGPNLDVVQGNCGACHSSDYMLTQPRGEKFKQAFWEAEVTKMINVYGAPIEKADIPKIVEYLTATY